MFLSYSDFCCLLAFDVGPANVDISRCVERGSRGFKVPFSCTVRFAYIYVFRLSDKMYSTTVDDEMILRPLKTLFTNIFYLNIQPYKCR